MLGSLSAVEEFCRSIQNPKSVWTTVSPSAAEEKSRIYENRRRHWQRLIFSRVAALHVIQHIQSCKSAEEAADAKEADDQAATALAALDAVNSQAVTEVSAESRERLLDTRAKLEECATLCKQVAEKRRELIERANTVIQASTNQSMGDETEWQGLSELMHEQRQNVLLEIADKERRLTMLEEEEAKPLMRRVEQSMACLRQGREERERLLRENEQMKRVLADAHGIVADDKDDDNEDLSSFLAEEASLMSRYYDLAHKKASRVVSTEVHRTSKDEFQLTVTARSDWVRLVGPKGEHPRLKSMIFTYGPKSARPLSVALKVDLSEVPNERIDEVWEALSRSIAAWKSRALQSPAIDYQDIYRLFLVGGGLELD